MKTKVIFIVGLVLPLLACDNKNINSTIITNNYINNGQYNIIPNSKVIKKQKFEGSYSAVIESNPDGLITFYTLNDIKKHLDYKNSKYVIESPDKLSYKINFDDNKNILSMEDSSGIKIVKSDYDDKGRVIKIENEITPSNNFHFINQITYDDNLVKERKYEMFVRNKDDNWSPLHIIKIQFFYNSKKQLEKTIEYFYSAVDGQYEVDKKNQLIPLNQFECFFDEHNQYGDWTKQYCLKSEESTKFVSRTLEYY